MSRSRVEAESDRGAAAVEFALVLPLLLLIVFGIIDFGRAYNMQISLSQGAREGVRVLALNGSTSDATARTEQAAYPVTEIGLSMTTCPVPALPTDDAVVLATRTYDYITPIQGVLALMGLDSLATPVIEGRGRMRCNG